MFARVPGASAVFVGRESEVERLGRALARLPMAFVYGVPGVGKSALAYEFARRWDGPRVYSRVADGVTLSEMIDDVRRQLAEGPVEEVQCDGERIAKIESRRLV